MTPWAIAELVPHAGEVILLDEVLAYDADRLSARATVRAQGPFHLASGVLPNWVGLEFMAQAVAAWAGCQARACGRPVELGFLLGTRRYQCEVDHFAPGTRLTVEVLRTLQDDSGMGVFECSLSVSDRRLATARLNVYRPPDPAAFVQESLKDPQPYSPS